ncbi:MAG: B12-binding domain-containing radical SAM protein [Candidatus Omnitrophica bacterium]|nr:B12-binding domain-containing radical SAM protein [Candidatus Omnitrophota bacterium]MDD5436718.1 B12-binding domain-containing radical SAM protein [Candidatus Omnitrophota bacterium]
MRALLINPWIYDFAAYDLWSKPVGLLTIASHLKNAGWQIGLIDCLDRFDPDLRRHTGKPPHTTGYGSGSYYFEAIEKPAVLKGIPREFKRYGLPAGLFKEKLAREERPDIILVTTGMTYWYPSYADTVKILKETFPGVPVMLGGIYASLCYDHACKYSGADLVHRGSEMDGIFASIYKITGAGPGKRKNSSESLFPYYDLYPDLHYATLRTSKGCPFRCTYCGWYFLDRSYSRLDPGAVVGEIAHLNRKLNVKDFSFYDDALLYDAEDHIIKILEGILAENIKACFHTPNGLHSVFMTREIADLFKRCGFVRPRLALETASPAGQKATGAKTTNEDFLRAVSSLRDAGYRPGEAGAYILIGLPGQTIKEVEESVKFAAAQDVRIFLEEYSPIPGTPDYERSGLGENLDPLLHNNSIFWLHDAGQRREYQRIKDRVRGLNQRIRGSCLPL